MSKVSSLAISCFLVGFGAALVACGGGGPPPRPAEVPMDPNSGGTASTTAAPADTSAPSSDADPSAAFASAGGGGDAPAATAATTPSTPADSKPGKSGKGKAGKGGGGALSKSECTQLSSKGVDLLIAGMPGMDPSMGAQIKAQAAGDPNMAGMMTECMKTTTRAQYTCGMGAGSKDEWEKCLK
ncbi:MAG: hypothetical protein ABI461_22885 [Polyangiaceae bacterium]